LLFSQQELLLPEKTFQNAPMYNSRKCIIKVT
jgi:hypothetical protein